MKKKQIFHLIEWTTFFEKGTVAWEGFQNFKIHQSAALFLLARWWNSLLTRSCDPKNNWCLSRIFEARFRGEKKMRAHANRDPNMQEVGFYEAAQNFVYQIYSRVRSKKIKNYCAGWFSYPMAPLSCRSNLTGLYIYVKCKINFKEHTYQMN